tara:strand:+ start:1020 stop:1343 length:324 start_codon:yes stop_codon:yes gene_type:complete
MSIINNPIFNSLLTGAIIYSTSLLTNSGYPTLGAILTTFPIGILALLTINDTSFLNELLVNILIGNIIIVFSWLAMYFYSKTQNVDTLAIIGIFTWTVLQLVYFIVR